MKKLEHYLISLPLIPYGATAHCYLVTNDPRQVERAYQKLLYEAEQKVGDIIIPMLASTKLDLKSIKQVRKAFRAMQPDSDDLWSKITDFHISIWAVADSDPRSAMLNGVH